MKTIILKKNIRKQILYIFITLGIITKGMGGDFKRFAGLGLEGTGRLWINT